MTKGNDMTKKIGFTSIFLLGINGIIGSGIFLLPGKLYQDMAVSSLLVILFTSFMVLMIALCYAELASRYSEDGAAWLYVYKAFGKFSGFEVGLSIWFLSVTILAAETSAFLTTLQGVMPALKDPMIYNLVGIGILVLLFIANLFGTLIMKVLNNISSTTKLAIIILFIVVGLFFVRPENLNIILPAGTHTFSTVFTDFAKALSVIFYAFIGFSFLPVAAAKMDNPKRNIPLALVTVILTSTVLYGLITFVCIGILGTSLSGETLPAAMAFKQIWGGFGYNIIIIGMLVSIGGLAISFAFDAPVIASSMAEKELLPSCFLKKNKYGAPYISSIVTFAFAIILVVSGDFMYLISLSVFISFLHNVPSILAMMKLRKKGGDTGFKVPLGYTVPILALVSSAYLLTGFTFQIVAVGLLILVIGAIIYWTQNEVKKRINAS
ncbi:MAG: APC family permease [Anaerorhabdus sp.]